MALEFIKRKMEAEKAKQSELQTKRELKFYEDFRNNLVTKANSAAGRVTYLNGNLAYNQGVKGNISKIGLWNDFQTLANKKGITVKKELFDQMYQEFVTEKNSAWFDAYEYAINSGADPDDLKEMFKTNPDYRRDFLTVQSSLPMDELGQYYRGMMAETQPTGREMRGEGFISGVTDWAKENPVMATGTAVGTGLAAKKFGPGLVERFKGMSGPGGPPAGGGWAPGGKAATFLRGASPAFAGQLAGAGLGMLGMDEKTAGLAGAGVGAGLTARHMQRTLQPLYSIGVKDALSKDLIKGGKAAIIKNAKALGVSKKAISSLEKGTKGSQTVVKNAIKKKVTDTSSKALLKTGISSSLKTGAKFAGQQAIKKAGLIGAGPIGWMIGAGWTAYDIYKLLNPPKPKRAKYL